MAKKKTMKVVEEISVPVAEPVAVAVTEFVPGVPVLPTGPKRPPKEGIDQAKIWLFGNLGVGKSTLAASFPGVWFWSTDPGQGYLSVHEPHVIYSWEHFLESCAWMEQTRPTTVGNEKLQYICIDTADLLFKMCNDDVCSGLGIEDPSELTHGKAWSRLGAEFERVISKMTRWPLGLIFISHERDREIVAKGRKMTRTEPDIGAAGRRVIGGLCDFIFHCAVEDVIMRNDTGDITGEIAEQRVIHVQPSSNITGKCRKTHDGKPVPGTVPMDYKALVKALTGVKR